MSLKKIKLLSGKISNNKLKFFYELNRRTVKNLKEVSKWFGYSGYSKLKKKELIDSLLFSLKIDELKNLPEYVKQSRVKKKKGKKIVIKLDDKKRENEKKYPLCIKSSIPMLKKRQKETIMKFVNSDSKGFMVSHGTGCGKTLTAISYSQCFLEKNKNGKVIVLTPASLQNNFRDNMEFYGIDWEDPRYEIFSYSKFIRYSDDYIKYKCQDTLLICDEVQKVKSIKTIRSMKSFICSTKSNKVLLLTATPFKNNIYDFLNYINMINGYPLIELKPDNDENMIELNKEDLGKEKLYVSNIKKMKYDDEIRIILNLLRGKINYIKSCYGSEGYPSFSEKFITIDLGNKYSDEVNLIFEETPKEKRAFYGPNRKLMNKVSDDFLSPKIMACKKIIESGKTVIYTYYIEYGVKELLKLFKKMKKNIRYEIYSGLKSQSEKSIILKKYNNNEIDVMIITGAGAEGLDLKETKNMILLDPPWSYADLSQIMGRAVRLNSHINLPKKEQHVNIYKMVGLSYNDIITLLKTYKYIENLFKSKDKEGIDKYIKSYKYSQILDINNKNSLINEVNNNFYNKYKNSKYMKENNFNLMNIYTYLHKDSSDEFNMEGYKDMTSGDLILYNLIDSKYRAGKIIDKILNTFNDLEIPKTTKKIFEYINLLKNKISTIESKNIKNLSKDLKIFVEAYMLDFFETPKSLSDMIFSITERHTKYFSYKKKYNMLEPSSGLLKLLEPFVLYEEENKKIFDIDLVELNEDFTNIYKKDETVKKYISKINNESFEDFETNKKYDIIISNPPFGGIWNNKRTKMLYIKFIDKSIKLLNKNGVYIFIIPNSPLFWKKYTNSEPINEYQFEEKKKIQKYGFKFLYKNKYEFKLEAVGLFDFPTHSPTKKKFARVNVIVIKYVK
jgi:superfamily II DNA or RNA helicase